MPQSAELKSVMANARVDLAGNVEGQFSPDDWEKILSRAEALLLDSAKDPAAAWMDVIRDFHAKSYWGFVPNYKKPKKRREDENLGKRFIWYSFRSFLITKVVILYCGARFSADYDPVYGWVFFGAIAFMITNYGLFLYRYGGRTEK